MNFPKKLLKYLIPISFLFIGYFVAFLQFNYENVFFKKSGNTQIRLRSNYKYTNPLIECEIYDFDRITSIATLESNVTKYIKEAIQDEDVNDVALYFRDLDKGGWFGYNETEEFTPASLGKLPLSIYFLKKSESDPELLKKKILFDQANLKYGMVEGEEQYFAPSKGIVDKNEYTIKELIEYSLIYSDNNAHFLLFQNIDFNDYYKTLENLDIYNTVDEPYDKISSKDYGSIFRILYNSTYLSQDDSEWLLESLSKSEFQDGIKAGVDKDIVVANKFGEKGIIYDNPDPNMLGTISILQLHDCGIIYYPDNPYFICIMTEGGDYSKQEKVIQDLSKIVYKGVKENIK